MMPDGSSRSAAAGGSPAQSWPLPESEIAAAEAILIDIPVLIAQIELTLSHARRHLAALQAAAPLLRQELIHSTTGKDVPRLADLQAARSLRAELVKASQQSVAVSQSAARYLQARERFLLARRDWLERTQK